ncbi:MAG TPA: aspartate/glutamate racemase family protein [Chloroflexota bacterium]|nr:aspartate/glutamate racemase family protein [Chloroflexota bacterium]
MKLLIVNPNTSEAMTRTIDQAAHLYAGPGTEIVTLQPPRGPRSVEGYLDGVVAAEATLEVLRDRGAGFDACVIACFDDPGLYAAREALPIPVFGIAESAMLMACTLGHRFSILTSPARSKPGTLELVRRYGLEQRCASVRTVDLPILALDDDVAVTHTLFAAAGRRAIEDDDAEVLLLGCAGLAHLDKELERELGVPVLDGVACAVKMAEACHGYGLRTSKRLGFAPPTVKEYVGHHGEVAAVQPVP